MFDRLDVLNERDVWYRAKILIDPVDYANHIRYQTRIEVQKPNLTKRSLLDTFLIASARIEILRKDESQHCIFSYTKDNSRITMRQAKRYDVCLFNTLAQP